MVQRYGAAILALLLAACHGSQPRPRAPQGPAPAGPPPSTAVARYRIDPRQSELRLLVYRAGAMAALGHNHVIVNRALDGWVVDGGATAAGAPGASSFALSIPVAKFQVDEADRRREEGADFAAPVSAEAAAATLHNLQSAALLDAAQFPMITVRSVGLATAGATLRATVSVSVAGHESTLEAPFTLVRSPGELTACGTLAVKQTALGLTPFSVMLGALRVQDEIQVKFRLVAVYAAESADNNRMQVPSGAVSAAAGECRSGGGT